MTFQSTSGRAKASGAEVKTGTNDEKVVTPAGIVSHEGVAKVFCYWTYSGGTPSIGDSFNVTSITDNGAGDTTVTFTTPFASANYSRHGMAEGQRQILSVVAGGQLAGSIRVISSPGDSASGADNNASIECSGDR